MRDRLCRPTRDVRAAELVPVACPEAVPLLQGFQRASFLVVRLTKHEPRDPAAISLVRLALRLPGVPVKANPSEFQRNRGCLRTNIPIPRSSQPFPAVTAVGTNAKSPGTSCVRELPRPGSAGSARRCSDGSAGHLSSETPG